ncbi:MAG: GAF domain-containing protein [Chloroflexota bacterium]|nr:MAG: GAF domain-containing protein [Chloroflexota bacterium]
MPEKENRSLFAFYSIVLILSIISFLVCTILSTPTMDQIGPLIILGFFIGLLEFFPLDLLNYRYSLVHIIIFSGGILYGTGVAAFSTLGGIILAIGIQLILPERIKSNFSSVQPSLQIGLFEVGLNLTSLVIPFFIFGISSGIRSAELVTNQNWIVILAAGILFGVLHGGFYTVSSFVLSAPKSPRARWDVLALVSIEILPVFLGFTTLLMYSLMGDGVSIVLGVSTFALVLLIHYLSEPRRNLERRVKELTALEEISKALSNDIDLEKLLSEIQRQVTSLLNVNNFYVALLDPVDRQLWYPLAVKGGKRQNWPRRPLTDRLTDRVILESKAIMLPHHAAEKLTQIGLPSGEDAPYAWIGVPLIASEQTIGCLALFSLSSEVEFSQDDLNLLSILSGQTSVAIEIALHNALLSSDITIGRDRLTTILNSVRDGLLLVDTEGRITLINEAVSTLTGFPQSEYFGQGLSELSQEILESIGYSLSEADELIQNLQENNIHEFPKHTFSLTRQAQDVFIERTLIPVQSETGIPAGLIILLRDITDEHQIKQTQDLISETLVHDLRAPLSSTISALDVIHDAISAGDPAGIVEPSIQIAQRSSRRMLAMVESILEISRMESGKIELTPSLVDINQLLEHSISEFLVLAQEFDVTISNNSPEGLPLVEIDKNMIHRVLNNLIDNALKYSPQNGEVTINSRISDQELLEVAVSDAGPGIPDDYKNRIFERFVQIPGSGSRKRGSGLGLTYCRLAVEAHGGEIWVEDAPGGGSVFTFTLPSSSLHKRGNEH